MNIADINEGDLVRVWKGTAKYEGEAMADASDASQIWVAHVGPSINWLVDNLGFKYLVLEKAKPKLPTADGIYADRDYNPWEIVDGDGELRYRGKAEHIDNVASWAPFRLLTPEASK